ncbi:hypothetical protein [Nocardioides sp. AE5]|uniref:hypothetical protein n=1 Tax=Nocardioides sp. AE5 TaxID=2962573 RepID=UPI002880CA71|nr:hypothetical protein [Nocardioides sp. AE5]MDT0201974.1 hypothetical protein [Nocardioides sp. AE5]
MKVRDPQGQAWRVSRRWVPWRRHFRGFWDLWPARLHLVDENPIVFALALIMVVLFLIPFLLLLTACVVEWVARTIVMPFWLLGRVFFGRPWIVEVRKGFQPWFEMPAGRFRESRQPIAAIGDALGRGEIPVKNVIRSTWSM